MKATPANRKSWFSMPRVLPTTWWRSPTPPTPTPTPCDEEASRSRAVTPEARAPLCISAPLPAKPTPDVDVDVEYMNCTVAVAVAADQPTTPGVAGDTDADEATEMSARLGVPNISFSFFPDSDLIFASAAAKAAAAGGVAQRASVERDVERTGANSDANPREESTAPAGGEESGERRALDSEARREACDGSAEAAAYENFKDVQSSSSSEYQSIADQPPADDDDDDDDDGGVKTYESEYSIFIGKSVELVTDGDASVTAVAAERPHASPRNSEDAADDDDGVVTIVPRVSQLYAHLVDARVALAAPDDGHVPEDAVKRAPSKATKSLTDLTFRPSDAAFTPHKLAYKSESSSPKLTPRTTPIKLSDKFEASPTKTPDKPTPSRAKDKSPYQNGERPSAPPPLPPVDWSDALTATPAASTVADDENYEDVEEFAYCAQRALRNPRRASVSRGCARTRSPGLVRVRSRLGRVARAVSGWWSEERVKLGEVMQKHAHAQAVGAPGAATPQDDQDDQDDQVDGMVAAAATEDDVVEAADSVHSEATSGGGSVVVKRRQRRLGRPASRSGLIRSRCFPEGQNGFEELRRFIKQGGDFCKDLSSILQERSEAESQYAKSLSKLSGKLLKASKDSVGTVNQAWQQAGAEMEEQSEIHRAFGAALSEEVVKPLRLMAESQHRVRKAAEAAVDKSGKALAEWRAAETKSKKQSFVSARENEKLQDAALDARLAAGRAGSGHSLHHAHSQKIVSDKESAKLDSKRRKAEDAVKKADVEYYTFCIRAERARLEWETAVIRGSHCFQAIEEERLQNLKDIASCYLLHLQEMGPKMVECTERLSAPVVGCDVLRDIQTVVSIKGTGQPIPEQLLPDFYAEHVTLAMNRERRRAALVKLLQLVRQDIERERRGKQGVENLARALHETPTFGTEDSQQNVTEKLHHMRSMLTYLEAARYKVQSAVAELDGRARGPHPLASHIQVTRDRQGLQQSVLKVPPWVRKESIDRMAGDSPDWTDRGAADGNSVQPDSDFDEFSSQGSEKDYQSSILTYPVISECSESPGSSCGANGQCKALYEYSANLYDELNLSPGDIINIHDKQPDGWWLGELNGVVGIFPATYVEEMK